MPVPQPTLSSRQHLMQICASATDDELAAAIAALAPAPVVTDLRPPEMGLVMVQARIGGDGAPFNAGEATVTRAAVRLSTGETGFAYLLGRRPQASRHAAIIDALGQRPHERDELERVFAAPVAARLAAAAAAKSAKTEATRVNFFTLQRGESP